VKRFFAVGNIVTFIVYLLCFFVFVGVIIYVAVQGVGDDGTKEFWMKLGSLIGGLLAINVTILIALIFKIRIPVYIHVYWVLLVTLCVVLGNVFNFFDDHPWFNKVLHGVSGGVLTMFGFTVAYLLSGNTKAGKLLLLLTIFAFCFSLTLGLFWEILEFTVDTISGQNMQRWQDQNASTPPYESGLVDTMWDTIVHTGGALIVAVAGFFYLRKRDDRWFLIEKKIRKVERAERVKSKDLANT